MTLRSRGIRYGASIIVGAAVLFLAIFVVFRFFDLFPKDRLLAVVRVDRQHVPDFQLFDQTGASFSNPNLDGRISLLAPLYVHSDFAAPVLALKMHEAVELLGGKSHAVELLGISVDPTRDTVAAVSAFSRELRTGDEWHFLTGQPPVLSRIWRALRIHPRKSGVASPSTTNPVAGPGQPTDAIPSLTDSQENLIAGLSSEYTSLALSVAARFGTGYQLRYHEAFWLVDGAGRIRAYLDSDATPADIAHDLNVLIDESGGE